ncbi:hypothetical protein [Mycolicibacterium lutetiense]|uniref:Uncharacterized protein n=1 Tax=Mycolicibacterium lutetiense TaxID=1641992 RepID=A0ABS5A342_9MYCO|nr:hypothetical protein [Mycolicibacterium lutetiense]MBP2456179.1 hypothetical protein [Mycolicibacterium lutetiense]
MATYMLSESAERWVLPDDEGSTALLRGDLNTVLLDAAEVMRGNSDPVHGGGTAVPDTDLPTPQFLPR